MPGRKIRLSGDFPKDVNRSFRLLSRVYHIIHRNNEVKRYPIIINNFNRLEWLQQQVDWLLSCGQTNIHIIDNHSSYGPLLQYYKKVPATVYLLNRNKGHEALWRTHIFHRLGKYYHVYTDPDVLPAEDTPNDFMFYFKDLLNRYPAYDKAGFGLVTDDLPAHYQRREEVIEWEKQFYVNEVEPQVYQADIDTTFALYRPGVAFQCWKKTLRTGKPYMLRHMPWYENSSGLSEESLFYRQAATESSSWYQPADKS
ncbi:MAG: hypothetical protein QM687_10965 [Ferruginibacter sp.]